MDAATVTRYIKEGLPGAQVEVHSDDGVHFAALVVSGSFAGKRAVERHRLVYATLGGLIGNEIHALSLTTLAPGEARPD